MIAAQLYCYSLLWNQGNRKAIMRGEAALTIAIGFVIILRFWSTAKDWCLQRWKFWCHAALMDGPPALPIIGNATYFAGSADDLLKKMIALAQLYESPIRVWLGTKLVVGLTNPCHIKVVMKSSKATYKPSENRFIEAFFGQGLITTSGPTHKRHRSLIMPMVNGKALGVYMNSFAIQSQRCVECLENMVGIGEFDILPFMNLCTMDVTFDSIIGAPATAQQNGHTELVKCLHRLYQLSYEWSFKLWLHPDCIYYRTKRGKEHAEAKTIVQKFMDDVFAEKKKEYYVSKNGDLNSAPKRTVLLEQMIAYNEENKLMDDTRLIDEVFTVFAAAQDPTALISSFTFLMLAMHPEIQEKVRAEVQEVIGDGNLTAKTLSDLRYLDMVIKESVRLFPIASALFREVQEDLDLGSCSVPKGCMIGIFMFGVHRDPRFWDEPEKFNPDRFLPENSVGRHPYAYIPFSGGVRGCIGQQYAKMLIKTLVTRFVQRFRLHSTGSLKNLKLITDISVRSLEGYKVSLTRL